MRQDSSSVLRILIQTTVFESLSTLKDDNVAEILCRGGVFDDKLINSYYQAMLVRWEMELMEKIIPANLSLIRSITRTDDGSVSYDEKLWNDIEDLKLLLAKDTEVQNSIFTRVKAAVKSGDWEKTSEYQRAMKNAMNELKNKYKTYCDNQI